MIQHCTSCHNGIIKYAGYFARMPEVIDVKVEFLSINASSNCVLIHFMGLFEVSSHMTGWTDMDTVTCPVIVYFLVIPWALLHTYETNTQGMCAGERGCTSVKLLSGSCRAPVVCNTVKTRGAVLLLRIVNQLLCSI